MMDSIFIDTINEYNMLFKGDKVLVALSGGVDSVVLLYMLKKLQSEFDLTIEALHVNHCIRGKEADNDDLFCNQICKKLGINIDVYKVDVPMLSKQRKQGIEECARDIRYQYFYKMLESKKFNKIATAHNLNDNAETVLFNMIRGSGIKGLCGIPPVRDKIIRPLINHTKQQILDFAKENNIEYVFDKTNDDIKYTRNYIRHKILPNVLKINASFLNSSKKMCKLLSLDEDYISKQTESVFKFGDIKNGQIVFDKQVLIDLHDAVLSRLVIKCFSYFGDCQLSAINVKIAIDAIRKNNGNKIFELSKNIIIKFSYNKIIFKKKIKNKIQNFRFEIDTDEGNVFFEKLGIIVYYKIEDSNKQFTKNDGIVHINYDIIKGNIFFRNRNTNDSFVPSGGTGKRSVKKMLIDNKIPRDIRGFLPLLCCDDEVIWVYGLKRINNKYKPDENTKKILRLFINKKEDIF